MGTYLEPPDYGVVYMPIRSVFSENLRALMLAHDQYNSTPAIERATAMKGLKVGKSTIDRCLRQETPLNLDYIDVIARVFGLDAWQIMTPNLNPKNPPVLRSIGEVEDGLYRRMGTLAKEIAALQDK